VGYTSIPFSSLNANSKNTTIQTQTSHPLEQSKALQNKQQNTPINTVKRLRRRDAETSQSLLGTTALRLQDTGWTPDEALFRSNSDPSQMPPSSLSSTWISGYSAYTEGKGDRNMMKEKTDKEHEILFYTKRIFL